MNANVILLLALATLLMACANSETTTTVSATESLYTLRAAGEVEVAPDEATIELYLLCERTRARAAGDCLTARAEALHANLQALGIDTIDRQTTSLRIDRRYRWTGTKQVLEGYTANTTMLIKLRNLERLGDLYDLVLDGEDINLGQLLYGHSQADSLQRVAHTRALDAASRLAQELVAHTGSSSIPRLKSVRNSTVSSNIAALRSGQALYATADAVVEQAQASPTAAIGSATGTIRVTAQVWADYLVD